MENSKQIAGLMGPALIALPVSEALNFHIWATNIPQLTYLNGLILFVAGLSVVRVHHQWRGWPLVVTLAGWMLLLMGLVRMFAPEAQQLTQKETAYGVMLVLFLAGIFLTFKAYSRGT